MHFVFSWAPKLARKCDSNHWFPCGVDGRPVGWYTVTWLPNFLGWVDLLSYEAPPKRAGMELRSKLTSGRSTELKLWSIGGEFNRQINKLGFPRCITNSKLDSTGKRQGFDDKKPNWSALWRNTWDDILKQIRLRSKTHWKLLLYLDFRSYFEATSPNWFNVFCKILLQSIFLARIIIKKKPHYGIAPVDTRR